MKNIGLVIIIVVLYSTSLIGQAVISQVYGGGGNTGATYTHDFIEVFNRGASSIDLTGWSVQYASGSGTTWQVTTLSSVTLQPGQYYLIQQAQGSGGTTPLPTPDAIGTIAMSATVGKIALVNSTTALSGSCPLDPSIVDFVGFGTANCFEGTGTTPAPSNTTSVLRLSDGCTDDDDNSTDFVASTPTPRNTSSLFNLCSNSSPTISVIPSSLSGFTYVVGSGPSEEQSFSISGSNLTDDISVTPPSSYEISLSSGGPFQNTAIVLNESGGTVDPTTIYVRLIEGLTINSYVEDIIASSTDADDKTVTCSGSVTPTLPNAWINEFHYDNDGADVGEFVEVVVQNYSIYDLSDFELTLYNGGNGTSYGSHLLDSFIEGDIDPNDNSFRYYSKEIVGIQNGAPDGVALSYQGILIQFLSYEGSFEAVGGPADGVTSSDILVSQDGSELVGSSLGLSGSGTQYSELTWTSFDNPPSYGATLGSPNHDQALPVELSSFTATVIGSSVKLNWRTETEINNYGFEIQRLQDPKNVKLQNWTTIGFVEGYGNSNSPKDYSFSVNKVTSGIFSYRLKQIDIDGAFSYSDPVEVDMGSPNNFELAQNFPNPFNPNTSIKFNLPESGNVKLTVFNVLGQEVAVLINGMTEAGSHVVNFDAAGLNSGIYIYRIEADGFNEVRKMTLLK